MQKLQDMEERRIDRIGVCMKTFADVDRQVLPIVGKCLDGMTTAAEAIDPKIVSSHNDKSANTHCHLGHITHSNRLSGPAHTGSVKALTKGTRPVVGWEDEWGWGGGVLK